MIPAKGDDYHKACHKDGPDDGSGSCGGDDVGMMTV